MRACSTSPNLSFADVHNGSDRENPWQTEELSHVVLRCPS